MVKYCKKTLLLAAMLSTTSVHAGFLADVNKKLEDVNKALGATPSTSQSVKATGRGLPTPTEGQLKAIDSALKVKGNNAALVNAIAEASESISGFIKIQTCIMDDRRGALLNIYAAPGTDEYNPMFYPMYPAGRMQYHDKSSCVSVVRMNGWEMPAKNALKFEVVYVSDSSGESVKEQHLLVKQSSGEWLFRH